MLMRVQKQWLGQTMISSIFFVHHSESLLLRIAKAHCRQKKDKDTGNGPHKSQFPGSGAGSAKEYDVSPYSTFHVEGHASSVIHSRID